MHTIKILVDGYLNRTIYKIVILGVTEVHIPDGYLGPATCIFFYAIMVIIWFFAFRNANKNLGPRNVPMLSFMSALAFIIMMFNMPIPDGTTAHMIGAVLIAIVLGPYGATIALSVALLIQALLFGDGGITSYGANVFNMGVVMPFVGIMTYWAAKRALTRNDVLTNKRRAIAAGIGAYVGIVVAAFCDGTEFGIQPIIAPGYSPYAWTVSVPAMVGAHLIVGIGEFITTAIVVYYLAENRPDLLKLPKMCPKWLQGVFKDEIPSDADEGMEKERMPLEAKGEE